MKRLVWLLIVGGLLSGCQRPVVDTVRPQVQAVEESFTEQAETRLARTFPVTMPASGTIARVSLEPGAVVKKGQVLVAFDRLPQDTQVAEALAQVEELRAQLALNRHTGVEDAARAEAEAQQTAAAHNVDVARSELEEASVRARQAEVDLSRARLLHSQGALPKKSLEDAQLGADVAAAARKRAQEQWNAARAALNASGDRLQASRETLDEKAMRQQVLESQLAQVEARVARSHHEVQQARIVAPVDGMVLERYQQGPGPLAAGERLVLLGRRQDLEAVCEVLTEDAVKLTNGTPVTMTATAGGKTIQGHVRQIEPQAFTRLSPLGVEQKRVRVIVALDAVPREIGVGYRLDATFITARREGALTLPRFSVVQGPDRSFYVLTVVGDVVRKTPVTLGLQQDIVLQIASGLTAQDVVVAAPEEDVRPGMRVQSR